MVGSTEEPFYDSPVEEEPVILKSSSSKPNAGPWFTLDDTPPREWRKKFIEMEAWLDTKFMKDADPYKVIEEFCCRMTGTLKEWYHNLGAVRQNQFHELRHFQRMNQRFYLLNGLNDPSLKNTYVASLPEEIQPELNKMSEPDEETEFALNQTDSSDEKSLAPPIPIFPIQENNLSSLQSLNHVLKFRMMKRVNGDGSVDYRGGPALKKDTGNWRACPFILGNESCEHLAFYGIATNLVNHLTTKLHEGNVSAARNVSIWLGTSYLTPIIGAVLADGYWGRYWTIAVFSVIYFIGMCTLTLSASLPALKPAECLGSVCPPATPAQYAVFYFGLYVIALGIGGIKSCVPSFGADQFDDTDPVERIRKWSFFNWYYFSIYLGAIVSSSIVVWIQDNAGWGLGFGIPTLLIVLSMASFFIGTPLYRFQKPGGSPVTRMCQVLCASVRKWNLVVPEDSSLLYETPDKRPAIKGNHKLVHSDDLRCLDRAAIVSDSESKSGDYSNPWKLCTVTQVEELKILICMFPMWATGAVFSAVYTQMSTLFVEQGTVMNTHIGSFEIPPASLATVDAISVVLWAPAYDRIIVPFTRKFTGNERGISVLHRVSIGYFISVLSMLAAAIVEIMRLRLARELDLVDEPVAVPLSILWQIPQYFLLGAAEVFAYVGLLEFFYDQSPDTMKTLGIALSPLYFALGNYLSSFILTMVIYFTTQGGKLGWIPDNLNKGHLDYFFLLLAGLSFLNMLVYFVAAKRYKKRKTT
ncbi:Protein NRT1/ PTR FAMILY 8.3 [Glycine soja]|uniref:Protein NRT1/ PTR FAMILY 8.3 n=3 Tax=Glycine soja TaxID=3848 RepID=A0A445KN35_GLYSO|nr:Protein NRT1/ PTR FAMILY 8.3 [Glycine soja]